jgi:hypothetical protein
MLYQVDPDEIVKYGTCAICQLSPDYTSGQNFRGRTSSTAGDSEDFLGLTTTFLNYFYGFVNRLACFC